MKWAFSLLLVLAACGPATGQSAFSAGEPVSGDILLTGNKAENTLSLIDLASGTELARLETGVQPHEIAISPDGRRAAVVAYGGSTIDIFDIAGAIRVERIDLTPNRRPHGLIWLADNRLVATTEGSNSLTVVDMEDQRVSAIATGQRGSHMVAVSADFSRAYVANMGSGTVSILDLETRLKIRDLQAGSTPEGLALAPDGQTLWVADRDNALLIGFDTNNFERIAEIPVGNFPIRVAISPDGRSVVTSNYADGALTVVDAASHTVARTITVSGNAQSGQVTILFSADGATLFVAETGRAQVVAIDFAQGEVLRRYDAGAGSDGLAVTSLGANPAGN